MAVRTALHLMVVIPLAGRAPWGEVLIDDFTQDRTVRLDSDLVHETRLGFGTPLPLTKPRTAKLIS